MTDISLNETGRRTTVPRIATGVPHPAGVAGALARATGLAAFWRAWQRRRRFRALLDHDDRMLDDMGLTRLEIERAAGLPLQVNAAVEARRLAETRRGVRQR
jgi:uncharacterized protein YjiS (DUF1127 family)